MTGKAPHERSGYRRFGVLVSVGFPRTPVPRSATCRLEAKALPPQRDQIQNCRGQFACCGLRRERKPQVAWFWPGQHASPVAQPSEPSQVRWWDATSPNLQRFALEDTVGRSAWMAGGRLQATALVTWRPWNTLAEISRDQFVATFISEFNGLRRKQKALTVACLAQTKDRRMVSQT